MVKLGLVYVLALASSASASLSFHGYHHNRRTGVKPFGPSTRGPSHHTVYEPPIKVPTPQMIRRNRNHRLKQASSDLDDMVEVAGAYLSSHHGANSQGWKVKSAYRSDHTGVTHVHFRQVVDGLEVVNGNANVNVDRRGLVISSGNSFATIAKGSKSPAPSGKGRLGSWEAAHHMARSAFEEIVSEVEHIGDAVKDFLLGGGIVMDAVKWLTKTEDTVAAEYIEVKEALKRLAHHLNADLRPHQMEQVQIGADASLDGEPGLSLTGLPRKFAAEGTVKAQAVLVKLDDGSLAEAWDLEVEQDDHWWSAQINARTGKVAALVDWAHGYADEAYRVYPWQVADPLAGERRLLRNPADAMASPMGWARGNQTAGNNVWAQSNPDGGYSWKHNFRPASKDRAFDYSLDLTQQPSAYIESAIAQLFYTNNFMHDLSFHYGFDEQAGNFQDENFSGKGKGGDAVIANAQDGSGYNNANFATPPDGRRPKMRMYVWDITQPRRDGDLEQGIVVHEYTHGISTRLTGGPANSNCLAFGESGGMGEGWGDIMATIIRLSASNSRADDISMGEYSAARGIRKYPYSTSLKTNPSTYGIMDRPSYWEVHAKGEVWAAIFYEVLWNLIDEHGFTADLLGRDLAKGNTLALQLLVDGMKLQPCMPNFIDARDAILLADKQLTQGKNQCLIWRGFAKRGLGVGAELLFDSPWGGGSRTEDFGVPAECK